MRHDLTSFTELIEKLQIQVGGSTKTRILGRIRFAISDKQILKCHLAFRSHIEMLNFVQSLLISRQISHVHATLGVTEMRVLGRLDCGLDLIEEEVSAIHETLSKSRTSPAVLERELVDIITRTDGSFESVDEIKISHETSEQTLKRVYWKWSMYQLPVGTLTTEVAHSEDTPTRPGNNAESTYKVTFKFQPPRWLTGAIFQVSCTLRYPDGGHKLPYWQRTCCGAASLLPVDLSNYLEEGDFLSAGACLSMITASDIQRLCRADAFEGMFDTVNRQVITHIGYGKFGASHATQQAIIAFKIHETMPRMRCPKIHISYEGTVLRQSADTKADHDAFVVTSSAYRLFDHTWDRDSSLESTRLMLDQFSESEVQLPSFCVSLSRRGLQGFKNYIGQHLDPLCCSELSDMDRWWTGALLHTDSSIRAFLGAHFASFRSPGTFPTLESSIPTALHYERIVQEVLSAPRAKKDAFVMFLCAFGTDLMLHPFIMRDREEAEHFASKRFLRAAVISRNPRTYDVLCDFLEETGQLRASFDLDLLTDFLNWDFLGDDSYFIDELTQEIPPTSAQNENPSSLLYQYATKLGEESSTYVMERLLTGGHACYCNPPYARDHFLGPEVLKIAMSPLKKVNIQALETLLDLGASVDFVDPDRYMPSMTALEAVVHQASSEALGVILRCRASMASPEISLLAALKQSENNLAQKHPRRLSVTFLKTDISQQCYNKHTSSVDASSDAECCLILTIALGELNYLHEADCVSRIKNLERFYRGILHSDSDENSDRELDSDSNSDWESEGESSLDQTSDVDSEDGQDYQQQDGQQQPLAERLSNGQIDNLPLRLCTEVVVSEAEVRPRPYSLQDRSQIRGSRRQRGTAPGNSLKHHFSVFKFWLLDKYDRISLMSFLYIVLVMCGMIVSVQFLVELAAWKLGKWGVGMVQSRKAFTPLLLLLISFVIYSLFL